MFILTSFTSRDRNLSCHIFNVQHSVLTDHIINMHIFLPGIMNINTCKTTTQESSITKWRVATAIMGTSKRMENTLSITLNSNTLAWNISETQTRASHSHWISILDTDILTIKILSAPTNLLISFCTKILAYLRIRSHVILCLFSINHGNFPI